MTVLKAAGYKVFDIFADNLISEAVIVGCCLVLVRFALNKLEFQRALYVLQMKILLAPFFLSLRAKAFTFQTCCSEFHAEM